MALISKAYIRHYSDNGQTTAYVEWTNGARTEGPARKAGAKCPCGCGCKLPDDWGGYHLGTHILSLFNRAKREGITINHETW